MKVYVILEDIIKDGEAGLRVSMECDPPPGEGEETLSMLMGEELIQHIIDNATSVSNSSSEPDVSKH